MKVCVTGGAGFIGSHIVDGLLHRGHEVSVLDNLTMGRLENLHGVMRDIEFIEGDVRDPEVVARAVRGAEVVLHQAALGSVSRSLKDPREVTDVNVGGTLNVLLAARDAGVRRVVFASSSSVYGDTPVLPKVESMPLRPRSPYAATKCAGEAYVSAFQGGYGMEGVVFRYFNVFGPRQRADSPYAAVIPLFIEAMRSGKSPVIHGDGGQTRDFTFVSDVSRAVCMAVVAEGVPDGPCNVGGGGNRVSILSLADSIRSATGFGGAYSYAEPRPGDVRDSLADVTRVREWLGWTARIDLDEGIALTVAGAVPSAG